MLCFFLCGDDVIIMKPKELAQFREEKDTFPENGEPKVR